MEVQENVFEQKQEPLDIKTYEYDIKLFWTQMQTNWDKIYEFIMLNPEENGPQGLEYINGALTDRLFSKIQIELTISEVNRVYYDNNHCKKRVELYISPLIEKANVQLMKELYKQRVPLKNAEIYKYKAFNFRDEIISTYEFDIVDIPKKVNCPTSEPTNEASNKPSNETSNEPSNTSVDNTDNTDNTGNSKEIILDDAVDDYTNANDQDEQDEEIKNLKRDFRAECDLDDKSDDEITVEDQDELIDYTDKINQENQLEQSESIDNNLPIMQDSTTDTFLDETESVKSVESVESIDDMPKLPELQNNTEVKTGIVKYEDLTVQTSIGYGEDKKVLLNLVIRVEKNIAKYILSKHAIIIKVPDEKTGKIEEKGRVVWLPKDSNIMTTFLLNIVGEYNLINNIGYIEFIPSDECETTSFMELAHIRKELQPIIKSKCISCSVCDRKNYQCNLLRCGGCKNIYYCSKICQEINYVDHKRVCK